MSRILMPQRAVNAQVPVPPEANAVETHPVDAASSSSTPFSGSVLQVGYGKIEYVPLCSFGPGGAFTVDWEVRPEDVADPRRLYPPRTLGSAIRRVAGRVLWDLKGWLVANHPSRKFRIDYRPAALEPCAACGWAALWPQWFVHGHLGPQEMTGAFSASLTGGMNTTSAASTVALASPLAPLVVTASEDSDEMGDVPANYPFPHNFSGSNDLEPVAEFAKTSAGRLLARLSADPRDPGTLRLFAEDDLIPSGIPAAQLDAQRDAQRNVHLTRPLATDEDAENPTVEKPGTASADHATPGAESKEQNHDTHPQTTQNPHCDPGLPRAQRLLADNAGTGRSTRSFKGHHLRARRGSGAKGPYTADAQQGSLFGGLADGEAA